MKRKLLVLLLIVVTIVSATLALSACSKEDHEHNFVQTGGWLTTLATCTESGYGPMECTICGKIKPSGYIEALGHDWEITRETQANCSFAGYVTKTCKRCGATDEEKTDALDHDYELVSTLEPTCEERGINYFKCTRCGREKADTIYPKGHELQTVSERIEPTCLDNGLTERQYCKVCDNYFESEVIPALGHDFRVNGSCVRCGVEGEFTVTFVADGKVISTQTYKGNNKNIVEPEVPQKEGYKNARWEEYTLNYEDLTVHALYDAIRYTITYVLNEKDATHSNNSTYTIESDFALLDAEKKGYRFEGWTLNGKPITHISPGLTGDITLEGTLSIIHYTLTSKVDGQDYDAGEAYSSYTVKYPIVALPTLSIEGMTHLGWQINGEGSTYKQLPAGTTGDLVLHAVLMPNKYTVTLNANGGGGIAETAQVTYNSKFTLPVPVMAGHDFLGWYTEASGGEQVTYANGLSINSYTTPNDSTVYAHWQIKTLTVTFNTNGGNPLANQTYTYGDHFVPPIPTHPLGYEFEGWYSRDLGLKYTEATVIVENTTMYARWINSIAITTAEQLLAIADNPEGEYRLANDINLKGEVWKPIENFSGIFDGKGYKIKNFILSTDSADENFALILVNDGTVKNLILEDFIYNANAKRASSTNFGIFVAQNNGTVSGCTLTKGTVQYSINMERASGIFRFGFIVGLNKGIVDKCSSYLDVECNILGSAPWEYGRGSISFNVNFCTGGVVGENDGGTVYSSHYNGAMNISSEAHGEVHDTYFGTDRWYQNNYLYFGGVIGIQSNGADCFANYCDVTVNYNKTTITVSGSTKLGSENSFIGGLVGANTTNSTITSCYASGTLNVGTYTSNVVGGLVGQNSGSAKISSSYSKAHLVYKIGSAGGSGSLGGFVGENSAFVQNCYATGSVNSQFSAVSGGFAGQNTSTGSITKCYSTGNVSISSGTGNYFAGSNQGTFYNCYYLHGVTVQVNGAYITPSMDRVADKPYSELWSEAFLVGDLYWDEEGWIILLNEDPILDWEVSVNHDYNLTVVAPTCTDFGYTVYTCRDCNRIFVRNFVNPLGHDLDYDNPQVVVPTCTTEGHVYYRCNNEGCDYLHEDKAPTPALGHVQSSTVDQKPATCTQSGYTVYHCDVCDNDFSVITEPTGHSATVKSGDERVEPTCNRVWNESLQDYEFVSTPGRTARVTCAVCDAVIEEAEEISPHVFAIDEAQSTKPTCTAQGKSHLTCTKCGFVTDVDVPATGHTVIQGTAKCGVCGMFVVDEKTIVKISNVDGLKAIANNLGGVYMLTADINLKDVVWTPIGTQSKPFTGMLFGNGHKITNLNLTDLAVGGLFGYNAGTIVGLTIDSATISVANVENAVNGVFAAVNTGKIVDCVLNGTVDAVARVLRTANSLDASFDAYSNTLGGIAGTNAVTGTISGCTVNATVNFRLINELLNVTPVNLSFYLSRGWKLDFSTSAANFAIGGIAGENNGTVTNCVVNGIVSASSTQNIFIERTVDSFIGNITYKAGKLELVTNLYAGALVGYNSGTVSNCRGRNIQISRAGGTQDDSGSFFAMTHIFNTQWDTNADYRGLVGCSPKSATATDLSVIY